MTSMIVDLADPAATDPALTGGKGASLARSIAGGFPVPPGFVVTAEAYRASWAPGAADRELPGTLVDDIAAALEKYDHGSRFAVRSSGTMEDLAEAAFAGQHDTFLGVLPEDVTGKVAACFSSLWSNHAVAYRDAHGFAHERAAMAVVVQIMVSADVAGVAFTIDPIAGRVDRIVIESAFGLGESVVSGEGGTDQFVLAKRDLAPISTTFGRKEHALRMADDGGISQDAVPDAEAASLTEAEIAMIGKLALAAEAAAGYPQDIEWAISGGRPYLLQSRPVTTLPERWTRDESAERFPNPVTPLTWDFVEGGFHQALSHSFEVMGLPRLAGRWFAMFDGYVYGNQNAVEVYMGRPPAVPRDMDELRAAIPAIRTRFVWLTDLPSLWSLHLDRYLLAVGGLMERPLEGLSLAELWAEVQRVNAVGAEYFRNNIAISLGHSLLHKALAYGASLVLGARAPEVMGDLLAFTETKTSVVNAEIAALGSAAQSAGIPGRVASAGSAKAWLDAGGLRETPDFEQAFKQFIGDHGHRELDFDPHAGNWRDAPWIALETILLGAMHGADSPDATHARAVAMRAERSLLDAVPDDLAFFFHELIRLARAYESLDDIEHYQTSRLTVPMRRAAGALGQALVARGVIHEPMDVFFARKEELDAACLGDGQDLPRLADRIAANKLAWEHARAREPAWELGAESSPEQVAEGALRGVPGSPGRAEGTVHVVRGPDDFAGFPVGGVLVARTTNPAWTPLFRVASAVVAESGGPLSHGAVTAREARIPAVMAVRGVLGLLRDGDKVRVDGTAGTIERLT